MPKHLWMQDLSVDAHCPKCGRASFKRSNTRSGLERLVRRFTPRIPYRCHSCGYRTLIDPSNLRHSSASQEEYHEHVDFTSNVEVPEVNINTIMEKDKDKGKSVKGKITGLKGQSSQNDAISDSTSKPSAKDIAKAERAKQSGKQEHTSFSESENPFPKFEYDKEIHTNQQRGRKAASQKHPTGCPKCGEKSLYRSHSRSMYEALRKKIDKRRLYRCHDCDWRGWLHKHI